MGKKQHSKDKMYLLQSEWQYEGGGYRNKGGAAAKLPFRRLPFQCCALSLAPFQDPMMTPTVLPWCVCVCARACVRACVRACLCASV